MIGGVEFASVYIDMGGVETTLLEFMPDPILPIGTDREVANTVARSLQKRGVKAIGGAKVGKLEDTGKSVKVPYERKGKQEQIEVDQVLIAVGRTPATSGQASPRPASRSTTAASSRSTSTPWRPPARTCTPSVTV